MRKVPLGVIVGIMPWNFPYYQVARFAAPALMAGNVVMVKHAEICPRSAAAIAKIFDEAGAPKGLYTNLYAKHSQVSTLINDDRVQGVSLTGSERAGRAIAFIRDMTGDPVIAGDRVIAGSSSGRISAFDLATGLPDWTERDGAMSPVLVAGGSVFAVNDQAQLVRVDAATGGRIFAVQLPYYTDTRVRRQDSIVAHYGPVLAGGRLFVAGSDGVLRIFDPDSGTLVGQGAIPGGAATAPVVSGGTLYVTGRDGRLHAFR
mgnify:CR=1 FL=1